MRTTGRFVLAGLLGAALLGAPGPAALAPSQDPPTPSRPTGPQEAQVVGLVVQDQQPTVLLEGKRDRRRFAMAIGPAEFIGIAWPLQGVVPPRPLTHDLFLTLFGQLQVTLTRVVITDLRDNTYYAQLHLAVNGRELTLDSRPSDAIALAIRAKAPVLVEDRVFDKSSEPEPPRRPSI